MGEGGYAYCIEYKTMMTMLLSSLSSFISLRRMGATSLTATHSPSPFESFTALGPWVRVLLSSVGMVTLSFVALGPCMRVVVVPGRWSFESRCRWSSWLLGSQCHPLGAGRRPPFIVCFACGCRLGGCRVLGGRVCLCWGLRDVAAGDVEGALVVVDAGDVGVDGLF